MLSLRLNTYIELNIELNSSHHCECDSPGGTYCNCTIEYH